MANLYEISRQLENFAFDIDEETGELLNAVQWDDLNMAYAEKVENIACYIKNLNSDTDAIKAEELSLKKRRQAKEKKVEYLKRLLSEHMGGEKFETSKCSVSFRKSTVCEVEDETAFIKNAIAAGAFEYLKQQAPTINKTAIKDALKHGGQLFGATLVDKQNLVIK